MHTVLDLWVPLVMGAPVVIASAAMMRDFAQMRDLISRHKVASFTGVPSALQVGHVSIRSLISGIMALSGTCRW